MDAAFSASAIPCNPFTVFARRRCAPFWNSPKTESARCASRYNACATISAPPRPWSIGSTAALRVSCRGPTIAAAAPSRSAAAWRPSPNRPNRRLLPWPCAVLRPEPRNLRTSRQRSRHSSSSIRRGVSPSWYARERMRVKLRRRCARGIAFRAVDIEPLQDRAIVRDIVMLIGALLHLGDRTAWLALLRAPWAGVSLADLLLIARGAPLVWDALADDTVLQHLSEDGRVRCRRLRSTLEAAFRVRNDTSFARWVERTWLGMGGASCASSPEDLDLAGSAFARLRELEQRGLPDPADLRAAFADLYADHGAAAAVEIMTIHKAKGLEFDMVVLPALDRHIPRSRDQLLVWHEFARTGRDGMGMAARPAIGADSDRLFEFLRHQLRDAAELEAERLLYVACTRAKWQLRLTATVGRAGEPEEAAEASAASEASSTRSSARRPWSPRAGSLLAVLWPVVGAEFALAEPYARTEI